MIVLYTSLIFSCVWLGVIQAKKLHTREAFYNDMLGFLRAYYSNLSFVQKGFYEIVKEYLDLGVSQEFVKYLSSFLSEENYVIEILSTKEKREIDDIFNSLGKQDEETERRIVDDAINLVQRRLDASTKKTQKYSGFSIKLSLLVGILLVILLL